MGDLVHDLQWIGYPRRPEGVEKPGDDGRHETVVRHVPETIHRRHRMCATIRHRNSLPFRRRDIVEPCRFAVTFEAAWSEKDMQAFTHTRQTKIYSKPIAIKRSGSQGPSWERPLLGLLVNWTYDRSPARLGRR
ncbi:hypothetical protein GCM10009780_68950 [Actinomadura alba]